MSDSFTPRGFRKTPGSSRPPLPNNDQRTRQLENDTAFASPQATAAFAAQLRPIADPNGVMPAWRLGFQNTGRIVLGVIMDGTPIANCYRVHLEKGLAPIVATSCAHGSAATMGATAINTYMPGTSVVVLVNDKSDVGYILGGVPSVLATGARGYHDYISQAARKRIDELHKKHIKQPNGGQLVDYSAWLPIDSTFAAEWGATTSTGLRVTLDDFMVQLAVNEFCGVYGFYHDQLLRLAGVNMQVWTGGSERDAVMDQAEYNDTTGYAPYPWEAAGILVPGLETIQEYAPETYLCPKEKPYYAHWENKNEYQQPYHRTQIFYGYLGQGGRSIVQAPPPGINRWTYKPGPEAAGEKPYEDLAGNTAAQITCTPGTDKEKSHEERPAFGLHEDNIGLDGRRFIASAKGIVLAKRTLLPVPQRIKRPDSPDGDTETNYKFSGQFGGGTDHSITGDIATTDADWPNLQRAAAVLDLHGYLFNYAGLHPFYWHAEDYKTWEQSELQQTTQAQANQKIPEFTELTTSMFLKAPDAKKWKIDHRYAEQDYYEAESFISLLEDGGVVIGDGYGSEIRMTGGSVFISAPGDVWLKSGRNTNVWAGADFSLRAHNSIDVSTTNDSIRMKSEKHFMLLSGNSGQEGGMLIESRARTPDYNFENCGDDVKFGGIVLRARQSTVAAVGESVYLGTPEGAGDGKIILDAARGTRSIVTSSDSVYTYVKNAVYHAFGTGKADEKPDKSNYFTKTKSLLCGNLSCEQNVFTDGYLMSKKDIYVAQGHIFTSRAGRLNGRVVPLEGNGQETVSQAIDQVTELTRNEIPTAAKGNADANKRTHFAAKKIGDKDVQEKLAFSFRTDAQYKVADFLVYEDRWQQMAGISGKRVKYWEEKSVKAFSGCAETYPFPGKRWLADEPAYVYQELNIAEFNSGGLRDIDRGAAPGLAGAYSQPRYRENEKVKLNGSYPIIGKDV